MLLSSSEAEQEQLRTSKSDPWRDRWGYPRSITGAQGLGSMRACGYCWMDGGENNAKRSKPSGKNPNLFLSRPAATTHLLITLHTPLAALASSTPPLALSSSSKQEVPVRIALAGGTALQDLPPSTSFPPFKRQEERQRCRPSSNPSAAHSWPS
jgi:hypothetical protein